MFIDLLHETEAGPTWTIYYPCSSNPPALLTNFLSERRRLTRFFSNWEDETTAYEPSNYLKSQKFYGFIYIYDIYAWNFCCIDRNKSYLVFFLIYWSYTRIFRIFSKQGWNETSVEHLPARLQSAVYSYIIQYTPLEINIEHNHGGLEDHVPF